MAPLSHYNFPASLPVFVCLDRNPKLFSQFHPGAFSGPGGSGPVSPTHDPGEPVQL